VNPPEARIRESRTPGIPDEACSCDDHVRAASIRYGVFDSRLHPTRKRSGLALRVIIDPQEQADVRSPRCFSQRSPRSRQEAAVRVRDQPPKPAAPNVAWHQLGKLVWPRQPPNGIVLRAIPAAAGALGNDASGGRLRSQPPTGAIPPHGPQRISGRPLQEVVDQNRPRQRRRICSAGPHVFSCRRRFDAYELDIHRRRRRSVILSIDLRAVIGRENDDRDFARTRIPPRLIKGIVAAGTVPRLRPTFFAQPHYTVKRSTAGRRLSA